MLYEVITRPGLELHHGAERRGADVLAELRGREQGVGQRRHFGIPELGPHVGEWLPRDEALAMQRPVMSTSVGAEGLDLGSYNFV